MNKDIQQLLEEWEGKAAANSPEKILLEILQNSQESVRDDEQNELEDDISPFIYPH